MSKRLIQDLHAAISRRDWHAAETAANRLRDEVDQAVAILAGAGIGSLPNDYPLSKLAADALSPSPQPILEAAKEIFAVQELRDIACKGSDAPAEHALGVLLEAAYPGEEWIDVEGHKYRKFIRFPEEVDDDTLRCIACGQIDEEEYHDDSLCRGCTPSPKPNVVVDEAILEALSFAMGWQPSEDGPSYREAKEFAIDKIKAALSPPPVSNLPLREQDRLNGEAGAKKISDLLDGPAPGSNAGGYSEPGSSYNPSADLIADQPPGSHVDPSREGCVGSMTADRAIYFLRRFKADEKMLGPHEQWALDFTIAALSPPPQTNLAARWLPIGMADRTINHITEFTQIGLTLKNSDTFWVRDEDGRVYRAAWSEGNKGRDYWWDWEAESPVDPIEFMPHPLDPRWHATTEGQP